MWLEAEGEGSRVGEDSPKPATTSFQSMAGMSCVDPLPTRLIGKQIVFALMQFPQTLKCRAFTLKGHAKKELLALLCKTARFMKTT